MHFAKQITDHIHTMEEGTMVDPATAPWSLSVSGADLKSLKVSFEPADQNNKWVVLVARLVEAGQERHTTYFLLNQATAVVV